MRRLKTKHSYHDGEIQAVEFEPGDCVVFEVELCGCSDIPGATIHLSFHSVKNIGEVRSFFDPISGRAEERGWIAEIVGLEKGEGRRYGGNRT